VGLGAPFTTETSSIVSSGAGGAIKNYGGGMVITGEFLAIVVALGFYTASFISEIVRGSILALPAGQTEAAKALGLSAYQRLTLIILPQALRTMIPPLGNQYINMTKNTSIAVAIGFSDVVFATRTISNNAGHSLEIFTTLLVLYLLMALVISSVMNSLNWYVQRSGI
jgi:general L-amino acid transport system permease protein